jgi:formamidopyrimidine-DNA glycosylase
MKFHLLALLVCCAFELSESMVEGHSVHRVATLHRNRFIGKIFKAYSPNGRFKEGAEAIDGEIFYRIEAVGKNLFAFFGNESDPIVVHIHFGMAGNWAVYEPSEEPPKPTSTNRLRLECDGIVADLSAMTVQHGGIDLFDGKRAKLGEDPLRDDADPERLWERVQKSRKSIGALVMDQSYFTGPGNIYRAEILFKARVHPDRIGSELEKEEFDLIWYHTVALLRRGYETGSILTVDAEDAKAFGNPRMRRYIYNTSKCPGCTTSITTWQIASRTCYACPTCQPLSKGAASVGAPAKACVPFNSHCARESAQERLKADGPSRLNVKEIKAELSKLGVDIPRGAAKATLVELLQKHHVEVKSEIVSSESAAMEKAAAGESLAVEHIAELAPGQARKARSQFVKSEPSASNPVKQSTVAQLKEKLRELGVEFPAKSTKSKLLELLQVFELKKTDTTGSDDQVYPEVSSPLPRKRKSEVVTPSPSRSKKNRRA